MTSARSGTRSGTQDNGVARGARNAASPASPGGSASPHGTASPDGSASPDGGASPDGAPTRPSLEAVLRRGWRELSVLLAAALWWPVGFWGLDSWLHLPLRALEGDVLLLGATASAASVSLLVRSPWPRFAIVVVFSALGWVLSAPAVDAYPDEREVLVILLAVAAFLGIVLGARGSKGPLGAATVLAVCAGLSPATWPHGLPLAVALALPFLVASWQRVAPTVLSVTRILLTWLVVALGARALSEGWTVLHPNLQAGSKRAELRLVGDASWDFVRTQWWEYPSHLLASTTGWLWVAAILALLVAATRAVTSGVRRRSRHGSSSRPGE